MQIRKLYYQPTNIFLGNKSKRDDKKTVQGAGCSTPHNNKSGNINKYIVPMMLSILPMTDMNAENYQQVDKGNMINNTCEIRNNANDSFFISEVDTKRSEISGSESTLANYQEASRKISDVLTDIQSTNYDYRELHNYKVLSQNHSFINMENKLKMIEITNKESQKALDSIASICRSQMNDIEEATKLCEGDEDVKNAEDNVSVAAHNVGVLISNYKNDLSGRQANEYMVAKDLYKYAQEYDKQNLPLAYVEKCEELDYNNNYTSHDVYNFMQNMQEVISIGDQLSIKSRHEALNSESLESSKEKLSDISNRLSALEKNSIVKDDEILSGKILAAKTNINLIIVYSGILEENLVNQEGQADSFIDNLSDKVSIFEEKTNILNNVINAKIVKMTTDIDDKKINDTKNTKGKTRKIIKNNQIVIEKNDENYTISGYQLK